MRVALPPPPAGLEVAVSPLAPLPPVFTREALVALAGAGAQDEATALGWPCAVVRGAGGVRVVYRFLDHGAIAEARGDVGVAWAYLREARPDWAAAPAAPATLADLFKSP